MASMCDWGDVFQLVIDRFDNGTFPQEEFIHQGHQLIFHVFVEFGDQLQMLLEQQIKECLGNIPFIAKELAPDPSCHLRDRFPVIPVRRREFDG